MIEIPTKVFSGNGFQSNVKNLSMQKYVKIQEKGMQKKTAALQPGDYIL